MKKIKRGVDYWFIALAALFVLVVFIMICTSASARISTIDPTAHQRAIPINTAYNGITFNGDFIPGETLYSNTTYIKGYMFGKPVYPIRPVPRGIKIWCNCDGVWSNRLCLSAFEYNDGSGWNKVPAKPNKVYLDGNVQFRVNIPEVCSPAYHTEQAIQWR